MDHKPRALKRTDEHRPHRFLIVHTHDGVELVAIVRQRTVTLRPKGAKSNDGEVTMSWGRIYDDALLRQREIAKPRSR